MEAQLQVLLANPSPSKLKPFDQPARVPLKFKEEPPDIPLQREGLKINEEPQSQEQSLSKAADTPAKRTDAIEERILEASREDASKFQQEEKGRAKTTPRKSSRPSSAKRAKGSPPPGIALYKVSLERIQHAAGRYAVLL